MLRLGTFLVVSLPLVGVASAQVTGEVRLEVASKYISDGVNLVNDWVLQPGVTLYAGGFSLGVWGNGELTDWNLPNYEQSAGGRMGELDVWLDYTGEAGDLGWFVGLIDYQFPNTGWARYQEWYGGLNWGPATLTLYSGANSWSGSYVRLGLEHSFTAGVPLDTLLEVSLHDQRSQEYLYGRSASGFTDLHAMVGTTLALGGPWSLTPAVHFSTLLDGEILEGEPRRSNLWVSLGVACSF